jgi:hypothetical protein
LPLEVEIQTAKGEVSEKLEINRRKQSFMIQLKGKPDKSVFDKSVKLPLLDVKLNPLMTSSGKKASK